MDRARIASAGLAVILHVLALYALLAGLGIEAPPAAVDALKLFDVGETPPPPPLDEPAPAVDRPKGPEDMAEDAPEDVPAPPNLRASPAPIIVPLPEIRLDRPSPIVAAPVTGPGADPSAGASERAGPGTGAAGVGFGLGGGGLGGEGRGAGGSPTPAYKLGGELMPLPLPRRLYRRGADISFRIAVGPDGRVTGCTIHRMTGAPEIGAIACRAIVERYRYRPARDAQGRPVADVDYENHAWGFR